MYYSAAYTII